MATIERREPRTEGGAIAYVVRYRDASGKQRAKSFAKLKWATSYRSKVEVDVAAGTYVDPALGKTLLTDYAEQWLNMQTFALSTRALVTVHVNKHIVPTLGDTRLAAFRPSQIQAWVRGLENGGLAPLYIRGIFGTLRSILSAAVDDGYLPKNPCLAGSVNLPKRTAEQLVPWTPEETAKLVTALPERYQIAGWIGALAGLRQGEIFGLAVNDIDFLRRRIHVRRQVKIIDSKLVFDLPKGGKQRVVPLSTMLSELLADHLSKFPALEIALPWVAPTGDPTTAPLVLTTRERKAPERNYFNSKLWHPALKKNGVTPIRATGMHSLRHSYASVLLSQGVDIRTIAEYLGHADAGFTLRVYSHLMPDAEDRARTAIDAAFAGVQTATPATECVRSV